METCQVILHHHDPLGDTLSGLTEEKTAIVQAADAVAHLIGYGHPEGYPDQTEAVASALNRLGIKDGDQEKVITLASLTKYIIHQIVIKLHRFIGMIPFEYGILTQENRYILSKRTKEESLALVIH